MKVPAEPKLLRIAQALTPWAAEKARQVYSDDIKFIHYTSASAALNILTTEEVWLRRTMAMNDFQEMVHGIEILNRVFRDKKISNSYFSALDFIHDGISHEIREIFPDLISGLRYRTYISCLSMHNQRDFPFGRLSMWRGYGGQSSIAIVIRPNAFRNISKTGLFSAPAFYTNQEDSVAHFSTIGDKIRSEFELFRSYSRDEFKVLALRSLCSFVLCAKHPEFSEEEEWRIIYSEPLGPSEPLVRDIRDVGGSPQIIYRLPLQDRPEFGLDGVFVKDLIDKIIVGPSKFPADVAQAFSELLRRKEVPDWYKKVVVSEIPLRT